MARDARSLLAQSHALRMFPTLVWRAELLPEIHRRINRDIIGALAELRRSKPALMRGQAWQSEQGLHRRAEFREVVACVEDGASSFLQTMKIRCEAFEITACWANVNAPGAGHRVHSHPNNFLSGAYYVRTGAGADTINFHDPRSQTGIIRPPVTELTSDNTDQVVVQVADGTLLLFPAWLPHSVDANASADERISVSFNIMFPAYAETMSEPLWEPR